MRLKYFEQYKFLKPEYKSISDHAAVLGGILGFVMLVPFTMLVNAATGIDPNECVRCQEGGTVWIIAFIFGLAFFVGASASLILWFRVRPLLRNNEISKSEVRALLLYQSYPLSWLDRKG